MNSVDGRQSGETRRLDFRTRGRSVILNVAIELTEFIVTRGSFTVVFSALFCFYPVSIDREKHAAPSSSALPSGLRAAFDDPARTCLLVPRSPRSRAPPPPPPVVRSPPTIGGLTNQFQYGRSAVRCVVLLARAASVSHPDVSGRYRRYARERRDDDRGRGRAYCPETTRLRVISERGTRGEWRYPTGEHY